MMHLRYWGQFASRDGVEWRVEILQESEAAFGKTGELQFQGDEPLTLEWDTKSKEEVICGSIATLTILSPGDRTYEDLYTIEPGLIRMDLYKGEQLYWSGGLDPEFYEEPYEQYSDYPVTLTFSDFGILDRLRFNLDCADRMLFSLSEVLDYCLVASGLNYGAIDHSLISTTASGPTASIWKSVHVRGDNFIDEDGERLTLSEVICGIFQPLALRMIQRAGTIYIYDINGLYRSNIGNTPIRWSGDSQMLGTDKVYNNLTIKFSPYSKADLLTGDNIHYTGKYGEEFLKGQYGTIESGTAWSEYYRFGESKGDVDLADFAIFIRNVGSGAEIGKDCRFFKILPLRGSAPDCEGVAYGFKYFSDNNWHNEDVDHWVLHHGVTAPNELPSGADPLILRIGDIWVPEVKRPEDFILRLSQEILVDAHYNPFSGADEDNFENEAHELKVFSGYVYIPYILSLYREESNEIWDYVGEHEHWVLRSGSPHVSYLEYTDPSDIQESAGVGNGWGANGPTIGRIDLFGHSAEEVKKRGERTKGKGEAIAYPPHAGRLELSIMAGIFGYDFGHDKSPSFSGDSQWHRKKVYDKLRWVLYKSPKLSVVRQSITGIPAESDDIEYGAYINKKAHEELSLDTICGTVPQSPPTARGLYYYWGNAVETLRRYDYGTSSYKELSPERLLMGTLFSQFATRHVKLTGEADIVGGLHKYTEKNQGRRVFILSGDIQHLAEDYTEAEFVEISPDTFEGIEETTK